MGKIKLEKQTYDILQLVDVKLVKKVRKLFEEYQHYIPKPGEKDAGQALSDEYEKLLKKYGYECKGTGTNRLVFYFNDKYKDVCLKLAYDNHGREANKREFMNSKTEISKYLTYVYAIDMSGTIIVEEMVTPFLYVDKKTGKDKYGNNYKDYEQDIVAMLEKLRKKILLVDCKIKNFCNFGLRKDGSVCLLDHGDTVPLPDYQTGDTVNADEESYVSLRCKAQVDETDPKSKLCGGKLKYTPGYDYLYCTVCHKAVHVNDAYRLAFKYQQEGYHTDGKDIHVQFDNEFLATCIKEGINPNDSRFDDDEEDIEPYIPDQILKEKVIDNNICIQINSYWIPEKILSGSNAMFKIQLSSNKIDPVEFLKRFGITNTDDYKIKETINMNDQNPQSVDPKIKEIADRIGKLAIERYQPEKAAKLFFRDVGMTPDQADAVRKYMLLDSSRYHSIGFNFDQKRIHVYFDREFAKTIPVHVQENNPEKKSEKEKYKMNNSLSLFANYKQYVQEASKNRETNEDPVEATVNYVVHGMVCAKSSDYYLPVKFYKPGLDHDETKMILKSEGLAPKEFKIENNPNAQVVSKAAVESINTASDVDNDDDEDEDDFEDLKLTEKPMTVSDIAIDDDDDRLTKYTTTDDDDEDEIEEEIRVPENVMSNQNYKTRDRREVSLQSINDAALYRNMMESYGGISNYISTRFPEVDETGEAMTDYAGFPGLDVKSNITTVIVMSINDSEDYNAAYSSDNNNIIIRSLAYMKKTEILEAAERILIEGADSEISDYNKLTLNHLMPKNFNASNTDYTEETFANAEAIISSMIESKYISTDYIEDADEKKVVEDAKAVVDDMFERFAHAAIDSNKTSNTNNDFFYQTTVAIVGILKDCCNEDNGFTKPVTDLLCKTLMESDADTMEYVNEVYHSNITIQSAFEDISDKKPEGLVHIHRIEKIANEAAEVLQEAIAEEIHNAEPTTTEEEPDKKTIIAERVQNIENEFLQLMADIKSLISLL